MIVFAVEAKSESCDDYGPILFTRKPSVEELKALFMELCPDEVEGYHCDFEYSDHDDAGPGNFGNLHVQVYEREVIENG